jgi:hypothetical protein
VGRPQEAVEILQRATKLGVTDEDRVLIEHDSLVAATASGEWRLVADLASHMIHQLFASGHAVTAALQLQWIEARFFAGLGISEQQASLRKLASNAAEEAAARAKAAFLLLSYAEDTNDRPAATEAIAAIKDLPRRGSYDLIPHLVYHAVFGRVPDALEIATEIASDSVITSDPHTAHSALYNVGYARLRGGDFEGALAALTSACKAAEELKLWSACGATSGLIAEVHWYANDLSNADMWHSRSGAYLARCSFPSRGPVYYSMEIMQLLRRGAVTDAAAALENAGTLYPAVKENRYAVEYRCYEARIEMASGRCPSQSWIDELVLSHRETRDMGMQDLVADTVVSLLKKSGREAEALDMKHEYLSVYRRDPFPPPLELASLQ